MPKPLTTKTSNPYFRNQPPVTIVEKKPKLVPVRKRKFPTPGGK